MFSFIFLHKNMKGEKKQVNFDRETTFASRSVFIKL